MTNFPWPFGGVQDWLEGLWNWVGNAVNNAMAWLWAKVSPAFAEVGKWLASGFSAVGSWLGDAFSGFYTWLTGRLASLFAGLTDWFGQAGAWISSSSSWIWEKVTGGLSSLWTSISKSFNETVSAVSAGLSWVWDRVSEGLNTIAGAVASGVGAIGNTIVTMYNGLGAAVSGWLKDAMAGVAGALGSGLQTFLTWIVDASGWMIEKLVGTGKWILDHILKPIAAFGRGIVDGLLGAVLPGSPDKETKKAVDDFTKEYMKRIRELIPPKASPIPSLPALAGASAGVIGLNILTMLAAQTPAICMDQILPVKNLGLRELASDIVNSFEFPAQIGPMLAAPLWPGIIIPLRYRLNQVFPYVVPEIREAQSMLWRGKISMDQFREIIDFHGYGEPYKSGYEELTTFIPDVRDLVLMAVREAFPVEPGPPQFVELYKYGKMHGLSEWWSERYRHMAMIPMDLRQAYENLWRGYFDKDAFYRYLRIADIHERDWDAVYRVAFRPPGVRELGYGYDTGMYSVEDVVKYRRWGGLSPEDAEKAGLAMVAYRTEAEREALRREALYDFINGLDSEETLRRKLEAIGGRPEIIDLWVARAKYRADRDVKSDLIKVVKDQAIKGLVTEVQLREDLAAIGVIPKRIEVHVLEVQTRRARAVAAVTAEKRKLLTEAKLAKAWELGLIGDEEYVSGLVERDYTAEDARLLLEILRTPVPITDEEVERRKASITARINRVRRRYDLMILRLDAQLGLISDEIEASEVTQKEVLDVYDTDVRYLAEELAVAAPEKRPALEKRIALIRERRDVAVARHIERMARLKDSLAAAADRKSELLKMRGEELGELESELKALGVAG